MGPHLGGDMAIKTVSYSAMQCKAWDDFIAAAKNGTFLFNRGYMEYHADRFCDSSLMFFDGSKLLAVFPANIRGDCCTSHAGLTYGGVICGADLKTATMLKIFQELTEYLRATGATELIYKPLPHIYHRQPAEEDLYALFRCGAVLRGRQVSSAIRPRARPAYSKGRKACMAKARRRGLQTCEYSAAADIRNFWTLMERELHEKRGAAPVHSADEMVLLKSRFPQNIRLFGAPVKNELAAGVLIYETDGAAHCQYIASSAEGREHCAQDFLFDNLIGEVFADKWYFDFGTSCHEGGRVLDEKLILNKESFGGRAVCYDCYGVRL